MATASDRSPPGTFPFQRLPPEISLMIYPHELILQLNKQPPALLIALAVDPILYAEMRSIYFKINESVSTHTWGQDKIPRSLDVRHLLLNWNKDTLVPFSKTERYNNLETLTIDNKLGKGVYVFTRAFIETLLIRSSRMRRIVVRGIDYNPPSPSGVQWDTFRRFEQQRVLEHTVEYRSDGNLWVWEIGEKERWRARAVFRVRGSIHQQPSN